MNNIKLLSFASISVFIITIVIVLRATQLIQLNAAAFKYPNNNIALYDKDWKGGPYVINEVTSHRWYEKGQLTWMQDDSRLINAILEKFKNVLSIDISLYDNRQFSVISDTANYLDEQMPIPYNIEISPSVCLTQQYISIEKTKDGIIKDNYILTGLIDVEIHYPLIDNHIHDYEIRLNAPLTVSGASTPAFIESEVQQLYISESLRLLEDYIY